MIPATRTRHLRPRTLLGSPPSSPPTTPFTFVTGDSALVGVLFREYYRLFGTDPTSADPAGTYLSGADLQAAIDAANASQTPVSWNELLRFLATKGLISGTPGSLVLNAGVAGQGIILAVPDALTHEQSHRRFDTDPAYALAARDWFGGLTAAEQESIFIALSGRGYGLRDAAGDPALRDQAVDELQAFLSEGSVQLVTVQGPEVVIARYNDHVVFVDAATGQAIREDYLVGDTLDVQRNAAGEIIGVADSGPDGTTVLHTVDGHYSYTLLPGNSMIVTDGGGNDVQLDDVTPLVQEQGDLIGFSGYDAQGNHYRAHLGNVEGTVEYARDNATGTSQTTIYDAFGNVTFMIDSERGVINPNDGWGGNNPFDASIGNPMSLMGVPGWGGGDGGGGGGGSCGIGHSHFECQILLMML